MLHVSGRLKGAIPEAPITASFQLGPYPVDDSTGHHSAVGLLLPYIVFMAHHNNSRAFGSRLDDNVRLRDQE